MARVTVAFKGVVDGKIYPQDFKPGDLVFGNLADEVVKAGWANADESAPLPAETPVQIQGAGQPGAEDNQSGQGGGNSGDSVVTTIEIPADWQSLPWPQLRSLAAQVAPGSTSTKEAAISGIQAYIDANAKPTEEGGAPAGDGLNAETPGPDAGTEPKGDGTGEQTP